jgi:hypothetical protein
MTNPGWDLQKAAYDALAADAALLSLLPYVVLDQTRVTDWSTGTERGAEHMLMLHVWSRYRGKHEVYEIADAIRDRLDEASLTLGENRLINLRHQFSDLKRDEDGETYHAVLRFRAITEPLD